MKKSLQKVGSSGEVVEVKDGFAMNYLIPNNIAVPVTKKILENMKEREEKKIEHTAEELEKLSDYLVKNNFSLVMEKKANEQENLFEKITDKDIAQEIVKVSGIETQPKVEMAEETIKKVGEYMAKITLGSISKDIKIYVRSIQ